MTLCVLSFHSQHVLKFYCNSYGRSLLEDGMIQISRQPGWHGKESYPICPSTMVWYKKELGRSSHPITSHTGTELRKPLFCGLNKTPANSPKSDLSQFNTWSKLISVTVENHSLDFGDELNPPQMQAELYLLHQAEMEESLRNINCLKM